MKLDADWVTSTAGQKICKILTDAGFQVYFVGGCVRNSILKRPVRDIDMSTDARPETVLSLAQKANLKAVPTGIEHGTITVISNGMPFEVTTFRKDVETSGRHATVSFSDNIVDDARRRDFTMNALYANPEGGVVDPLDGLSDLLAHRVRFIDDPEQRIREDYLRILRFFRFHAWYGDPACGMDSGGLAAVAKNLDGLRYLSKERVGSEILKLLEAVNPAPAVVAMQASGVLAAVLPGADSQFLAPLVHLEKSVGLQPDGIRRLVVLGGHDLPNLLRLSRTETRKLKKLSEAATRLQGNSETGYRYGAQDGLSIALIRAIFQDSVLTTDTIEDIESGARKKFPVRASDLQTQFTGPALGRRLRELEKAWIDSGFSLTREELLK